MSIFVMKSDSSDVLDKEEIVTCKGDSTYQYQYGHFTLHIDGEEVYPTPIRHFTATRQGSGVYKRDRYSETHAKIASGRADITEEEMELYYKKNRKLFSSDKGLLKIGGIDLFTGSVCLLSVLLLFTEVSG